MLSTLPPPASVGPSVLDTLLAPDQVAACLAQSVPQAGLVEALAELTPAVLGAEGRIDAVVAVERHIAMLQARSVELLAAIESGDQSEDGWARDSVAAALRVPPASMRTRMTVASDLAERLPATLALLRAGRISHRHAVDLADATRSLSAESAAQVEAQVLDRAPDQTVTQFRASTKRAVLRVTSPAEQDQAHTDAVGERRVVVIPDERGMAWVNAYLPAPDAATVTAALDAVAYAIIHDTGGDTRTADQRRADALVDLCSAALADPHLPRGHGQRPAVQVTIAASTLMGLDQQPADLDGYGPITAAMARRIAADPTATWRRLLTDDHGHVQHAGTKTYRPPADMTRTVIARDQHCRFPGCRRTARYNDLDHITAWHPGDTTTTANLMSLCRRHHRLKHTGTWHIDRDDHTGTTTWTDPAGRDYQSRPPTLPTTTTGNVSGTDPPPF